MFARYPQLFSIDAKTSNRLEVSPQILNVNGRKSIWLTSALVKHEEERGCRLRRSTWEKQHHQHLKQRGAEAAVPAGSHYAGHWLPDWVSGPTMKGQTLQDETTQNCFIKLTLTFRERLKASAPLILDPTTLIFPNGSPKLETPFWGVDKTSR